MKSWFPPRTHGIIRVSTHRGYEPSHSDPQRPHLRRFALPAALLAQCLFRSGMPPAADRTSERVTGHVGTGPDLYGQHDLGGRHDDACCSLGYSSIVGMNNSADLALACAERLSSASGQHRRASVVAG